MSPQDSRLLQDFLNQLVQVRGVPKDPEADAMIQKAVAYQPDAAYLLVQRALLQQQALDNAKAEIAALQQQLRGGQGRASGGFLDPHAWGNSAGGRAHAYGGPVAQSQEPGYPQQPYQQAYAQPPGRFSGLRGGMGGMLGNIASTAAGVAAGAFLFQGLGHLLGNHDGNGFLGSQEGFDSLASNLDEVPGREQLAGADGDNLLGGGDGGGTLSDDLGLDDIGGDFDGGSGDDLFG